MQLSLSGIAAALGGEVVSGQVRAPAPGHSPGDRGMSVKLDGAAPGGFLVYLFNGGDEIAAKDYVRSKCGLPAWQPNGRKNGNGHRHPTDSEILETAAIALAKPKAQPAQPAQPASTRKLVVRYDYTDVSGTLLYQVERWEPKSFTQRRPDGNGGWIYKEVFDGVSRVPYRWPELAAEIAEYPDAPVFVCEGEKDTDNVRKLGLTATCVAGGVWTTEIADALRGRDIIYLEDHDEAGRKKSAKAAKALHGVAASVRISPFTDLPPDKNDATDWIELDPDNNNADALIERCRGVQIWGPSSAVNNADEGASSIALETPRFNLIRFDQVRRRQEAAYIIKGVIPRVGLVVIWGPPKCGKSFWTFDAMLHAALGREYRGRRTTAGQVVYLALEGQDGFGDRAEAFRQRHLDDEEAVPPLYLIKERTDLVRDHVELIKCIKAQCGTPSAVVIDTMNRSLVGSESKDEDMAAYIKAADTIGEAFKCAVIIIHHCGIDGTRPRGHTSLTGAADVQISIKRDEANNIVATVDYAKDMPEGAMIASKLEVIELGGDQDGDQITSCAVLPVEITEVKPDRRRGRTKRATDPQFRDAVSNALATSGEPFRIRGNGPEVRAVRMQYVRDEFYHAYTSGDPDPQKRAENRRKAFQRSLDKGRADFATETREDVEWIWMTN